jgi:hypothetical protein
MARFKGTFEIPANYEPQKAAPFDARMLVEARSDLVKAETWQDSEGDMWIYSGMIVAVASDINAENRGIYMLLDASAFDNASSWQKMADYSDISAIQTEIEAL